LIRNPVFFNLDSRFHGNDSDQIIVNLLLRHHTSVLDRLAKALSTSPWADDEYLLSSLFRDLFNEGKSIGKSLNKKVGPIE